MEDPALESVLQRLREALPEESTEIGLAIARAAFRRLPAKRTARIDPDEASAWLGEAVDLICGRAPGELLVRVTAAQDRRTLIEANVEDAPFLVSSVTEELDRLGLAVADVLHPIIGVERGADGRITRVCPARGAASRESYLRIELDTALAADARAELAEQLRRVLRDALVATEDFPAMRRRLIEVAERTARRGASRYDAHEVQEVVALLRWLADEHFLLLGARRYDVQLDQPVPSARLHPGSGLGILRDEAGSRWSPPVPLDDIPEPLRLRITEGPLLTLSRTNRTSTVHRRARMVSVGVRELDDAGRIVGEQRFYGLFSQRALTEPASSVPVLHARLDAVLAAEDVVAHSFDERQLRALFEALPKVELFQMDVDELRRALVELLTAGRRKSVRILWRADPVRESLSILLAVPRSRYDAALLDDIEELLSARLHTSDIEHELSLPDGDQALVHFGLRPQGVALPALGSAQLDQVDDAIRTMARSWDDELAAELARSSGREGVHLAATWSGRFGPGYREATAVDVAADDIAELAGLTQDAPVRMVLRGPQEATRAAAGEPGEARTEATPSALLRFRLYSRGPEVVLTSFLPVLESLGFVVVEEVPHILDAPPGERLQVHDFGLRTERPDLSVDLDVDGPRVAAAAAALWRGRAQVDSLNRLVLAAGLPWHDVAVLRAYRRYRRQVGTTFTEAYLNDALLASPDVARALVAYFHARFDPARRAPDSEQVAAREAVVAACDRVERFDHDRIVRGFLELVDATLRTNRWSPQRPAGPGADPEARALALKIDPRRVSDMPKPVPHVEVFVYSPRMEGVHLRGGPVARGGIRWSDRQEDFRTEVLGLMKAQMTKNAVIVPTGAKGGFVLKQQADAAGGGGAVRAPVRTDVRDAYTTFIRALLDVTDDVVDGEVVPPAGVRRADGDDAYLVVAADKGTATFSDTANAISEAYGYWLGDAFASGGSSGYDHKVMGITARGAWVAVRRHFRELDVDVQTDPVTVVGIGDMSGDVFGNGLLQSRAVRLVAAFDHRDVFLDPDPDPEASYGERRRLFELPGSSWQDYDRALLSPSGGVWSRTAKSVPLDDRLRSLLRVDAASISPPELISALLRMPCDLLYAGGIGTYVKASDETSGDVGDRANDAVRIDADVLGARVVGEGGNLPMTQRARVQYSRRGGRCNADFIDNAAGVDTSDREVNLKILLSGALAAGRLDASGRGSLLGALTDDVADGVLRDVYLQTWTLSQELALSPGGMDAYERLMADLEQDPADATWLDRAVEFLPSTAQVEERREAGAGLTRPELAVLLAYAKRDLVQRLLATSLLDIDVLRGAVVDYFPALVLDRFGDLVHAHRLRRELLATVVANDLVNRMGITYANRTSHELGVAPHEVAVAYWVAREVTAADIRWRMIEALDDRCDPGLQLELKSEVDRLVDEFVRSYVREGVGAEIGAVVDRDRPAFATLEAAVGHVGHVGSPGHRHERALAIERYLDLGIEDGLAVSVAGLDDLSMVPDVAAVARATDRSVLEVAQAFLQLGEELPLDALSRRLERVKPEGHWQRWQHRGLADELRDLRRAAAERALRAGAAQRSAQDDGVSAASAAGSQAVTELLRDAALHLERVDVLVARVEREGEGSLDAIAVVVRTLREALGL